MNYLKTTLLLGVLTGVLVIFGQFIGGSHGAVMFLVIAAVMNFVAYWFSDKIVLMTYHAQQVGPEDAPMLYNVVKRLAERANIPMPKVYIVENPSPNAFATGRNPRHASVAATTGILRILSEEELEGVMAHELSHVQNRDILISSIAATIAGAITLIANVVQWGAMFGGSSRDENDRGNIFVMLAMAILAPIAAMIIQMAISRSREYAADASGAKLCQKPLALASALGRLENTVRQIPMQGGSPSTAHLFIVNPFRGGAMLNLFSTHPPMEERIRRLEQLSREM
jgi:Zn-dependent protease with chaperone function